MNNRYAPEEIGAVILSKKSQRVVHVETNDVSTRESEVHIEAQLGIRWCLHPGEEFGHLLDIDAFPSKENVVSKAHRSSGSHLSPEHMIMVEANSSSSGL